MKKIIVFILIIIVLTIGYFLILYPGDLNKYYNYEAHYKNIAEEIYQNKLLNINENMQKIILTKDEMVEILQDTKIFNDNCNGYVVITKDHTINYKAYLKCHFKYKTTGFDKSYLE